MTNELMHFGVKGMKWGVRRKKFLEKRQEKKRKFESEMHDDYKKAHAKKDISSLSDTELRQRINRIQMEQQYAKLSPSNVARGRSCVGSMLKTGATIAGATSTVLTIYNNSNKIKDIIKSVG